MSEGEIGFDFILFNFKFTSLYLESAGSPRVLLVDGILKFQTSVDYFGSYALVEITLLLLVILPTMAVYIFTKE